MLPGVPGAAEPQGKATTCQDVSVLPAAHDRETEEPVEPVTVKAVGTGQESAGVVNDVGGV